MDLSNTPLYEALQLHQKKRPISLHVPGHKNGYIFPKEYNQFFQILEMDVTELEGLDDLHFPEGVILEAETLLANTYNVERSFFLVNGSTVGNLAMILAAFQEGDYVIVQRNCHKSILNGLQLVKANPVLISPNYDHDWQVAGEVSIQAIEEAYHLYPMCKGIILTHPNYYGMAYNMEKIIQFAHKQGIPVLVDEAHGAHFIGSSSFPSSAIEYGADIVVQSAHKTLPAMTMGSYLHVNSKLISADKVHRYLQMLQSSSPSYPIMASLDIARHYLATYSEEDSDFLLHQVNDFRQGLREIKGIKVLEYPLLDPLKITIQSCSQYSGYELQQLLQEEGIYTELADPYNVLFVLPLLKKGMDFPFQTIVDKLYKILKDVKTDEKKMDKNMDHHKKISLLRWLNVDERMDTMPIGEAIGKISGETIIPYPPGIPFIIKGEIMTRQDIQSLQFLLKKGAKFHGGNLLKEGKIKVISEFGGQNG